MFLLLILIPFLSIAQTLEINVEGIKYQKGRIGIAIFDKEKGFPKDKKAAIHKEFVDLDKFPKVIGIAQGNYAVTIFHDINNDMQLNTSFIGIPKEPFGFSNNVKLFMGPPSFEDSKITISSGRNKTTIKLKEF